MNIIYVTGVNYLVPIFYAMGTDLKKSRNLSKKLQYLLVLISLMGSEICKRFSLMGPEILELVAKLNYLIIL